MDDSHLNQSVSHWLIRTTTGLQKMSLTTGEQIIIDKLSKLKERVKTGMQERKEEIALLGQASKKTANKFRKLNDEWTSLEKDLSDAQKAGIDEAIKRALNKFTKRNARKSNPSGDAGGLIYQRQDLAFRIRNVGSQFLNSPEFAELAEKVNRGGHGENRFHRSYGPEAYRDHIMMLDTIGSLRDTVSEAAVFDPLRAPVLRDIWPVVPVTGAITTYPRETYWHAITATAEAVTLPASTPTDITVGQSSGFKIGSTVYGDAGKTEFGIVNSIDVAASTVNVTSTAGFSMLLGDELWSDEFTPTPEGLAKPFAELKTDVITIVTKTHASMASVTRQAIRDIPGLNRTLNGRLAPSLSVEEEDQQLFGSGVAPELLGVMNNSGINTLQASIAFPANTTALDSINFGMEPIEDANHVPTGVVMSKRQWREIERDKGSDLHYVFAQVPLMGTNITTVWRLAVVTTNAMRKTVAADPGGAGNEQMLVGDFQVALAIREREGLNFAMTDSHEDWFKKNLLALRAEIDSGIEVYYPLALTRILLDQ
jgi:hypothetical protein